jgi:RNA polymerase primary sigma factor
VHSIKRSIETSDGLSQYLQEIGRVALLTPEQELALAERVRHGDRKAREQMIAANLRLVVKISHDYENLGLPLSDLIAEGNIGLMKAVDRFDPHKGAKLSTYSAWWIKQSIRRALANQARTIRLPVHLVDRIGKMKRTSLSLNETLGREPTDEELAQELGTSSVKVSQLRTLGVRPASLTARVGEDDDGTEFGEIIGDPHAATPSDCFQDKSLRIEMKEVLDKLDPREAEVLSMRFGLDGRPERTLEDVGKRFKVTRERVRQIQNVALAKLRKIIEQRERAPSFAWS